MKGGFHSLEAVWGYLEDIGALGPIGETLLAMGLAGGALLLGVFLFRRFRFLFKRFRVGGGLEGIRTRKTIKTLRADGQLEGVFTFPDALELHQTGTIRKKSLEDKIVGCVVPIEILFASEEHGISYQLEMEYRSEKEVASWLEVAKALNLADISLILEEVVLMRNVIYHPEYDSQQKVNDETIGDKMYRRSVELFEEFTEIDGIARLRAASIAHLSKHAPHLLPLPTW